MKIFEKTYFKEKPPPRYGKCVSVCLFMLALKIFVIIYVIGDPAHPNLPNCSIEKFYIPALDISSNSTITTNENQTIYFDLKLWNLEPLNGLIYDPLNLTFSYAAVLQNKTVSALANFTFPGFYQGYAKTAHRRGLPETHSPVVLKEQEKALVGSTAFLRIELATAVRFKGIFKTTKRYNLTVEAKVKVNDGGQKVGKKGIKLTKISAAPLATTTFGGYCLLVIAFTIAYNLAFI